MTSQLQVLDITANKPFKDYLKWNAISGYFVDLMSIYPQDKQKNNCSYFKQMDICG